MEVLQPINGKRIAPHRDPLEEEVVLAKRFREEQHVHNSTPLPQQQQRCNVQPSVTITSQKQSETTNATSSSNLLSAEEMNAWIVHGAYSPRVVQSYCCPSVGVIYRGDCY